MTVVQSEVTWLQLVNGQSEVSFVALFLHRNLVLGPTNVDAVEKNKNVLKVKKIFISLIF